MGTDERARTVINVLVFTAAVNVVAWLGRLLGGDPTSVGPGFIVWGIAPVLVAVVMSLITRDWKEFGVRPNFKSNGRFYLLTILCYPVSIAIVLVLGLLTGASGFEEFSPAELIESFLPSLVTFLLFAVFEEVGWRGYLAPKVYSLGMNRYLAHAIVGVIWASWHFPFLRELWAHTSEPLFALIPRFILGTFVFAMVYGEIRIRTGSFWPAVLMHWIGNAIGNTLLSGNAGRGFVTLTPGREFLGSFGVEGVFMIVLFGILGVLLTENRDSAHFSN
ncbi:MAG: CPBP family intramembrane metalloprotease [Spirochaetes bacterium]|nr:CPBP family intramembrane metalloprotease [Spirochaetota bacterium]